MTTRAVDLENLGGVSPTGCFLIKHDSKTILHCIEKALQKNHLPGSIGNVAITFLTLLEADTILTFVSLIKDAAQEPC